MPGRPVPGRRPGSAGETPPCRRSFLARAARSAAGLASVSLLPWTASCAALPVVTPDLRGRTARIPRSAFDGVDGVLFRHPEDEPIYVHRHEADRFTAVSTRCTHRGCEVAAEGSRLVCPCHGSEYRLDGTLLQGPAARPLARYPVSSDGSHVLVGLDRTGDER